MNKTKKAFILSLIATIILSVFSFIIPTGLGLVIPMMIAGLLFMREQEASKMGGIILLIMGMIMIGVWVISIMEKEMEGFFLLIPAVMATVGGYLGIQGARESEVEKREYSKAFIISIMSFISASVSVFISFWSIAGGMGMIAAIFFVAVPLWIISVVFNTISTVIVKREEIIPKRTKILIIVSWCLIALPGLFLLLFVLLALW